MIHMDDVDRRIRRGLDVVFSDRSLNQPFVRGEWYTICTIALHANEEIIIVPPIDNIRLLDVSECNSGLQINGRGLKNSDGVWENRIDKQFINYVMTKDHSERLKAIKDVKLRFYIPKNRMHMIHVVDDAFLGFNCRSQIYNISTPHQTSKVTIRRLKNDDDDGMKYENVEEFTGSNVLQMYYRLREICARKHLLSHKR